MDIDFNNKFDNHIYTIYPHTMKNNLISQDKWKSLLHNLNKFKYTTYETKNYIYRDFEYSVDNYGNHNVIQKIIMHVNHHTDNKHNFLLIISKHKQLDLDSFPKLNVYHDEYNKIMRSYKFGKINLNLITCNQNNYIEITFQYNKNLIDIIKKDLEYVTKIIF